MLPTESLACYVGDCSGYEKLKTEIQKIFWETANCCCNCQQFGTATAFPPT